MTSQNLSLRDTLLAVLVVFIWGTNFVVVVWGLNMLPPLIMAAARFALVVFPAIFFIRKPDVPWGNLAVYGLCVGTGQFGLLYIAMDGLISPGVASVVMQLQLFFTIAIAARRTGEKPRLHQMLGLLPAIAGVLLILMHNGEGITTAGLVMVLGGAMCWGISNQAAREAAHGAAARGAPMNPLAYVVWASLFSLPALVVMSLVLEGPTREHRLGDADMAERGEHPVRLHDLGLAAVALSRRHGCAHVAAGACIRHQRFGHRAA